MTDEVHNWVRSLCLTGRILDVGSRDVNGCVRDLFATGTYTGIDAVPGRNVDIIADACVSIPFADSAFDTVLCLETLEHVPNPFALLAELHRVLRPAGRLALSAPRNGFPEHRHPIDCWRFLPDGMRVLLSAFRDVNITHGRGHIFATAIKPDAQPMQESRMPPT